MVPDDESAMLFVRLTIGERKRIKMAAVAAEMSYAELIISLLDERDARFERARRLQSSPLHAPQVVDEAVDE
jgi:hypothetical protein